MKEYKYKVMNDAMIKEIQELWDNGHAEAIAAYGWECANAGVKGYRRGYAIGRAVLLAGVGLGMVTGFAVRKICQKQIHDKRTKEHKEYAKIVEEVNK